MIIQPPSSRADRFWLRSCCHHSTKNKARQFYQNYRAFMADFGGIRPALRGRPGRGSDFRLAAFAVSGSRHKASARKTARLRKLRPCFIRPRRRKAAIPPACCQEPSVRIPPSFMKRSPHPCGWEDLLMVKDCCFNKMRESLYFTPCRIRFKSQLIIYFPCRHKYVSQHMPSWRYSSSHALQGSAEE